MEIKQQQRQLSRMFYSRSWLKVIIILLLVLTCTSIFYRRSSRSKFKEDLIRLELPQVYDTEESNRPPANSVFLLKIPFTEASLVQNLVLRRLAARDVTLALPNHVNLKFCYPQLFERNCPANRNDKPYDVIVHQLRYNPEEVKAVMVAEAKKVLLVRDPVRVVQEAFYENEWGPKHGFTTFQSFVDDYAELAKKFDYDSMTSYGNIQLFTLGIQPSDMVSLEKVKQHVEKILGDFDVIMVQERLMESLVLLKYTLSWDWIDVAVFNPELMSKAYPLEELSESVNMTLRKYNAGDVLLYDTMLAIYEHKVKGRRKRLGKDLDALNNVIAERREFCIGDVKPGRPRLTLNGKGSQYCLLSVADEREITTLMQLRKEDMERLKRQKNGVTLS